MKWIIVFQDYVLEFAPEKELLYLFTYCVCRVLMCIPVCMWAEGIW